MEIPTKDPASVACPRHDNHTSRCPNGCPRKNLVWAGVHDTIDVPNEYLP